MKGKHSCVNHLDRKPLTNVFLTSALLHNIYTIQENNVVKFHLLPRPFCFRETFGPITRFSEVMSNIIYSVLKSQFTNSL